MPFDIDFSKFPDCGALAIQWRETKQTIEDETKHLWTYARGKRDESGRIIAYFLDGAKEPLNSLQDAEKRLGDIEADIKEYASILGDFRSLREMNDRIARCRRMVENSGLEAVNVYKAALSEHKDLSPQEVEALDIVRNKYLARDRVLAEQNPIIEDLKSRMLKAREILAKY